MFKHKIGAALLRGRARGAGLTLGGLVALVVETGWVAGFGLVATLLVVVEWFMLVVVLELRLRFENARFVPNCVWPFSSLLRIELELRDCNRASAFSVASPHLLALVSLASKPELPVSPSIYCTRVAIGAHGLKPRSRALKRAAWPLHIEHFVFVELGAGPRVTGREAQVSWIGRLSLCGSRAAGWASRLTDRALIFSASNTPKLTTET
ncbi:hypothetical protein F2Q69_00023981 [Brassica cretica]|uniref:Uncharacterized protein n=1 Tax=Brassica cretica TaxID=69181 RepID=A0A8S9QKQ5_BRACR|nr:hypothetical protein F2Q69_00023981 [Brassica cretica]